MKKPWPPPFEETISGWLLIFLQQVPVEGAGLFLL
jgi:hypothetical protein